MSETEILRLRRKIVVASMVALFVSLVALVFAINYTHALQVDAGLRAAIEEIAQSMDGEREERLEGQDKGLGEMQREGGQRAGAEKKDQAATESDDGLAMHGGRKSARAQYASRFFCVLVDMDGNMHVRAKGNSEVTNDAVIDLAQRVLASGKTEGFLDDYKYVVQELAGQEESDIRARILFLDCTTEMQSLYQLLTVSVVVGVCAFAIASLFVFRFARLAVRPLEESARKQKQFVSDAGHELKTPLSVIATNMDILEVDLEDRPEEQEWINSTNRQVNNMRRLVNDLITLSKMEEQETDLVLTEISLSDVAYECVQTFTQLARAQGKELVASIDDDVNTRGDEPAIRQLMTILLDNAIKYATGDGTVQVEVRRESKHAVFLTRNDWAHDVEPKELHSLFDRFVRGERSRDRSAGNSGYGLGLSIARAIAERNSVRLEVCEDAEGRIVFRAVFA